MLVQAMDSFQVAKRQHKENVKAQYNDKKGISGAKEYFRASELGNGDRKIIYGFFAHQLPKKEKSARNLRQLENGDFVHDRYQTAWEEMGALISMEDRLSSRNDDYLKQFDWEWAGHYDGLLDLNILRAHALGYATVDSVLNEETGKYEIQVTIDEAYANSIGLFDSEGNISADYEPPTLLADVKTMNPWGFKAIKENGDLSNIGGYIDQIQFYMYMMNTPYGSIFIENKENNDIVEVQIVWKDLHEGVEYDFDEKLHGKQTDEQVRTVIDSGRFFGDETREGCVPRLNRLYGVKEELRLAQEAGDHAKIRAIFQNDLGRCSDNPKGFPCSWGHKKGKVETCEFFDHCWSTKHDGMAVAEVEACPPEAIWEFEGETEGEIVQIDSRKIPEGITQDGFLALVVTGALDYTQFLVDGAVSEGTQSTSEILEERSMDEALDNAVNSAKNLFNESGELKLGDDFEPPTKATEQTKEDGTKFILCVNCRHEITYKRLGNGGTKKCDFCDHTNQVIKE